MLLLININNNSNSSIIVTTIISTTSKYQSLIYVPSPPISPAQPLLYYHYSNVSIDELQQCIDSNQ